MSWRDLHNAGIGQQIGIDMPIASEQMRNSIETTRTVVDGLIRDVNAQQVTLSQQWLSSWNQFVTQVWTPFYMDHYEMSWTDITPATTQQLIQIHGQALAWRASFQQHGGRPTTPLPVMPRPSAAEEPKKSASGLLWGALVVTGIFAIGYAAKGFRGARSSSDE